MVDPGNPFTRRSPSRGDADRISIDLSCINCGYNLRTKANQGRCPECDTAISESLAAHDLGVAPDSWVKRLRAGLSWMLVVELFGADSIPTRNPVQA